MLAKYKNIIILSMQFNPDTITGIVDDKKFIVDIKTDSQGQYVIINSKKYYLDQFKVK